MSQPSQDIELTTLRETDLLAEEKASPDVKCVPEPGNPEPADPPAFGKIRVIKTCSLFANFTLLLAAVPQTSAALIDFAYYYSVSLTSMSIFVPVNCLSYLSGTWIGGLLYTRVNTFALLSCFSLLFVTGLALRIFMPNLPLFFVASSFSAVAGGAMDSTVNSHFMAMWDGERLRDSLMQGMHASWSAGAMAMGGMLKLFLNPDLQIQQGENQTTTDASAYFSSSSFTPTLSPSFTSTLSPSFTSTLSPSFTSTFSPSPSSPPTPPKPALVHYAFILFAGLGLLSLCTHVALFVWDRRSRGSSDNEADHGRGKSVANGEDKAAAKADAVAGNAAEDGSHKLLLTGRSALIPVIAAVVVRIFDVYDFISTFLPSYLFYGLGWSTPDASVAFSVFYAGQFSGRLLCVLLSAFIKPFYILAFNCCLIIVSCIVLNLLGHFTFVPYVTSFLMGIGNSSTFPSVFLWLSGFTAITGPVSASLFLGDLTSLVSPAYGYVIENRWPNFFICYASASVFVCLITLIVGHWLGLRQLAAQKKNLTQSEAAYEAVEQQIEDSKTISE